ncbi:MAG: hypothetical protein MUE68_13340 [Bacteroidetes bacterium]|jgi:hypothetical protein|nr:hypothetical protein [Bacteroidota bacterium]
MDTTDSVTEKAPPERRWLVLAIAFVTYGVSTLLGVLFWFKPIADGDHASGPLLSAPLGLAIYAALSVVLYDWAVRRTREYFAVAFVIGAAQYILVVDLTLRGERGLATAGASAGLILLTWASVALVYRLLAARRSKRQDVRV